MPRLLDLFCGRFGWSKAFAARGWECVGVDLVEPPEIPQGVVFVQRDILTLQDLSECMGCDGTGNFYRNDEDGDFLACDDCAGEGVLKFDFICASSPCEQFSVHGMKHFHPNPPYPELGIKLFEHTRAICEASGVPYVMENVRAAQQFVGNAKHHCGPFYLWGSGVPPLMNQGIQKGISMGADKFRNIPPGEERRLLRKQFPFLSSSSGSKARKALTAQAATIPPELANCVADYAERLLELTNSKQEVSGEGPIPSGQSSESKGVDKNAS